MSAVNSNLPDSFLSGIRAGQLNLNFFLEKSQSNSGQFPAGSFLEKS